MLQLEITAIKKKSNNYLLYPLKLEDNCDE